MSLWKRLFGKKDQDAGKPISAEVNGHASPTPAATRAGASPPISPTTPLQHPAFALSTDDGTWQLEGACAFNVRRPPHIC